MVKKFKVTFEVFKENGIKEIKHVEVESNTKKLAVLRAMVEISKIEGYGLLYKNVKSVEEVA